MAAYDPESLEVQGDSDTQESLRIIAKLLYESAEGTTPLAVEPADSAPNASAAASPTRFANRGANATLNVKASAGNVFSWSCYNKNAATRFMQLHNTVEVPADQAVPLYSFPVPTLNCVLIGTDFFTNDGAHFATGIAFAFSTTENTYTAGSAADQTTQIHFA